jgi:hypothetical protein
MKKHDGGVEDDIFCWMLETLASNDVFASSSLHADTNCHSGRWRRTGAQMG